MKVAITLSAAEVGAAFDEHFGRAGAYAFVDTESQETCVLANPAVNQGSGAGIQAAEFVVKQGAQAVISGSFGPKASAVLHAAGVRLYLAKGGSLADILSQFQKGELTLVEGS